jgi:H+/Cl- antiporter ClcA
MLIYYQFLLFGFWGYKIMENRNRDTILGALLGIFFGIFGIIICYFFSKKGITYLTKDLYKSTNKPLLYFNILSSSFNKKSH